MGNARHVQVHRMKHTLKISATLTLNKTVLCAVHVDVDFMGPFVTQVKKASRDVWMQLPPPVRQAAPYVGASLGTGILVYNIQQRRLNHAVSCNEGYPV